MKELKGKYVIVADTICQGHVSTKDENGTIVLYDSLQEATEEIFNDNLSFISMADPEFIKEMDWPNAELEGNNIVEDGLDLEDMNNWLDKYNYYETMAIKATEHLEGRKAIFTGQGVVIEGKPIQSS